MNTRLTTQLTALLATALISLPAAAIEEVVVTGTDLSAPARTVPQRIEDAMSDYVKGINEAQKLKLDADLAKLGQRRIQIAAAILPISG